MPIIRKVGKLGNSFDIRIPREIMLHLGVNKGDYIVWAVDKDKRVIVEKLSPKKHPGFFIPGIGHLKRERHK